MGNILRKAGIGSVPFVLLLVLIAARIALSYYTFGVDAGFTRCLYAISAAVAGLCIFFACRTYGFFRLYSAVLLSLFAISAFVDMGYSPVDEAAHFEYAVHLFNTWTLPVLGEQYLWDADAVNSVNFCETTPGTINHEAMQGPVYYIFLALFGSAIKDSTACFIAFRIIGLLLAVCTAVGLNKLTRSLFGLSVSQSPACRLLMLLTILSPGYLYRAARLNNEIMVCFLFAVLLYQFFLSFKDNRICRYWLVSLLSVLLFLTKSTAIYCMIFPVLLILFHLRDKRKLTVIASLSVSGLIALPWFKFNLETYQALTGAQKHFHFVTDVLQVNPYHIGADYLDAFLNFLPLSFFGGGEIALSAVTGHLAAFIYILLVIVMGVVACRTVSDILSVRRMLPAPPLRTDSVRKKADWAGMAVGISCLAVVVIAIYELRYISDSFMHKSDMVYATLIICSVPAAVLSVLSYRETAAAFSGCRIFPRGNPAPGKCSMHLIINIACIAVIFMALAVMVCGTAVSGILAVRGRYLYPVIPAVCVLLLNNKDCLGHPAIRKTVWAAAIAALGFVSADIFSAMIYKSMNYRNWLADGTETIIASDVTDNNWNKGVMLDGRRIIVDYSPSADYSLLRGRLLLNNGEYAWIDREERAGQYVNLYLKGRVDPRKINGTAWQNIDKYQLRKYSFYGNPLPLGNINGSRLSQSFTVRDADSLLGFSVIMATYGAQALPVTADYKILDADGHVAAEGQSVLEGVNDNQWADLMFQKPVQVKKNGKYRIELTLNTTGGKMLTVYAARNDVYRDGEFSADIPGMEQGLDLSFGLIQN